jgi:hypothetical protein
MLIRIGEARNTTSALTAADPARQRRWNQSGVREDAQAGSSLPAESSGQAPTSSLCRPSAATARGGEGNRATGREAG